MSTYDRLWEIQKKFKKNIGRKVTINCLGGGPFTGRVIKTNADGSHQFRDLVGYTIFVKEDYLTNCYVHPAFERGTVEMIEEKPVA